MAVEMSFLPADGENPPFRALLVGSVLTEVAEEALGAVLPRVQRLHRRLSVLHQTRDSLFSLA